MSSVCLASVLEEPVQAVRLVHDAVPGRAASLLNSLAPHSWPVAAALGVAFAVFALAWWRRRREDPAVRAFRQMSRHLRLGHAEQDLLKALAASLHPSQDARATHPAALLLSQHAFITAASSLRTRRATPSLDAMVTSLHRKVFEASGG